MGLIELHFHDADFDFSPSVVTGGTEDEPLEALDDGDDEDVESTGWASDEEADAASGGATGVGALLALVVLVVLAALVGWKRRGGDDEDVELEA